jgi:hypothetical protein
MHLSGWRRRDYHGDYSVFVPLGSIELTIVPGATCEFERPLSRDTKFHRDDFLCAVNTNFHVSVLKDEESVCPFSTLWRKGCGALLVFTDNLFSEFGAAA